MVRHFEPFGLWVLKLICACFFLLSLLSFVPGIHSARSHYFLFTANHRLLQHFVFVLNAIIYALGFYGIHWRKRLTWKLGWFALCIFFSEFLVLALASSLKLPQPDSWIASTAIVVVGFAVAAYWGYWWKSLKSYFVPAQSPV